VSNLTASCSWNTICKMDWALTKPSTAERPRFLPYHAYPTKYSIVQ